VHLQISIKKLQTGFDWWINGLMEGGGNIPAPFFLQHILDKNEMRRRR
jgi:hypothetical protein